MRFAMISSRREPFEIGARLLATLCFPSPTEASDRRRAAIAWSAEYLREYAKAFPDEKKAILDRFPNYARLTPAEIRVALRKTGKRLQTRILAGKMSRGYFQEHVTEAPAVLPPGMARLSNNELSKLILAEAHQSDPHNVENRIWRTSKPAIHLASGYDLLARALPPEREGNYQIDDPELHRFLVSYAEWAEPIVLGDLRFGVTAERLLRVRIK